MNMIIRLLGLLCAVAVVACWLLLGAHVGWTHSVAPAKEGEFVAEIAPTGHENRFVPGLDFLAAGLLGAAVIIALTLPPRKITK
jgi:hypothetical protein